MHLIRDSRDRYTQLYDIIIIEVGFVGGGEGNGVIPWDKNSDLFYCFSSPFHVSAITKY